MSKAVARPVEENTAVRRELARLTEQVEDLKGIVSDALRSRETGAERMLSAKEAAELLRVCTKTLTHMVKRDGLPAVKVGGQNRYRRAEAQSAGRAARRNLAPRDRSGVSRGRVLEEAKERNALLRLVHVEGRAPTREGRH